MKLKEFRKKMEKNTFTSTEAHVVGFAQSSRLMNLQLHQWKKSGDILKLKRGVYVFADAKPSMAQVAKALYEPCYFSLEYALSIHGIIPEAVFTYTLVTPKATRKYHTPFGTFSFQTLQQKAFTGYNHTTLMASKEKALVDYFYLNSSRLQPSPEFWAESRLEAIETGINFPKALEYAKLFGSQKLTILLTSFQQYATSG